MDNSRPGILTIVLGVTCAVLFLAVAVLGVVQILPNGTNPRANVTVLVTDTANNPIRNARVTRVDDTGRNLDTENTNSSGAAVFTRLRGGSHSFRVERQGHMPVVTEATVALSSSMAANVASDARTAVTLRMANESVSGVATYDRQTLNGTIRVPAPVGTTLRLQATGSGSATMVDTIFATTVGANGEFTFNNLPENMQFTLLGASMTSETNIVYTRAVANNFVTTPMSFSTEVRDSNLEVNFATVESELYIRSVNGDRDFATVNLTERDQAIVIEFSMPVATNRFGNITADGNLFTRTWSNENRTLTLTPATETEWFTPSSNVTIQLPGGILSATGIAFTPSGTTNIQLVAPAVDFEAVTNVTGVAFARRTQTVVGGVIARSETNTSGASQLTTAQNNANSQANTAGNPAVYVAGTVTHQVLVAAPAGVTVATPGFYSTNVQLITAAVPATGVYGVEGYVPAQPAVYGVWRNVALAYTRNLCVTQAPQTFALTANTAAEAPMALGRVRNSLFNNTTTAAGYTFTSVTTGTGIDAVTTRTHITRNRNVTTANESNELRIQWNTHESHNTYAVYLRVSGTTQFISVANSVTPVEEGPQFFNLVMPSVNFAPASQNLSAGTWVSMLAAEEVDYVEVVVIATGSAAASNVRSAPVASARLTIAAA